MRLGELLQERGAAICERWRDAILAGYGAETAARWRATRDPFANPFGHALAEGLPRILEAVTGDGDPGTGAVTAIEDLVRLRAVHDLAPSRAAGFVHLLRDAVRAELASHLGRGCAAAHAEELEALDGRIERLGFAAFDAYVGMRDQLHRIRQEELKRSVASLLRRWHGADAWPLEGGACASATGGCAPGACAPDAGAARLTPPDVLRPGAHPQAARR